MWILASADDAGLVDHDDGLHAVMNAELHQDPSDVCLDAHSQSLESLIAEVKCGITNSADGLVNKRKPCAHSMVV
jgi:hypothetical protein